MLEYGGTIETEYASVMMKYSVYLGISGEEEWILLPYCLGSNMDASEMNLF